jgi:hypothetical protein
MELHEYRGYLTLVDIEACTIEKRIVNGIGEKLSPLQFQKIH